MPDSIDDWLADVPDGEHDLASATVDFVRETLEEAEEAVKWNQPCFVVAGSNCLYVSAQSGYVNLGFYEGATLADPADLLEGTGKAMRHVKIRTVEALEDLDLAELVRAAAEHARR